MDGALGQFAPVEKFITLFIDKLGEPAKVFVFSCIVFAIVFNVAFPAVVFPPVAIIRES